MRRPPRPQPSLRAPRGWALAGALCGLVAATVIWAPAAWLARGVDSATQGQVLLQQPRGTLWNGSASLVFTGGAGSRDRTALPTRLEWTLRPRLDGARIQLRSECCTPTALVLDLLPRWQGLNAVVHDSDTRWPASLLAGLGTPWNTVDLQGQLRLATQALQLQLLWNRAAGAAKAARAWRRWPYPRACRRCARWAATGWTSSGATAPNCSSAPWPATCA
jgi:general secretion pathway protein N